MRTILLGAVLFYASYGFVIIGHNAGIFEAGRPVIEAISRQASGLFGSEKEPEQAIPDPVIPPGPEIKDEEAPVIEREATFSEHLETAIRAFTVMDRSCSEADRMQLGRAFYSLVAYSRGLSSQSPNAGDVTTDLTELEIYAQVIDATRRGVLRSRHFLPTSAMVAKWPNTNRQTDAHGPVSTSYARSAGPEVRRIASAAQVRLTRCPAAAP